MVAQPISVDVLNNQQPQDISVFCPFSPEPHPQ
jgi:hypothetical protein